MIKSLRTSVTVLAVALLAAPAFATVFPTTPHAASNFIPFGMGTTTTPINNSTMHQVFAASLFQNAIGANPIARIDSIGFAPGLNGQYMSNVALRLGYTNRIPGVASGGGGLSVPTAGGGGTPNASGAMTDFFVNPAYAPPAFINFGSNNFQMVIAGTPFFYNPSLGNLLVEIVAITDRNSGTIDLHVSRSTGSAEASRAYATTRFGNAESSTTATRMDFTFTGVPEPATATLLGLGLLGLAIRRRR